MHADSPSLIDWVDRSHRRRLCLKLRPQFPLFFSLSISYIEWAGRLLGTDGDTDRHLPTVTHYTQQYLVHGGSLDRPTVIKLGTGRATGNQHKL